MIAPAEQHLCPACYGTGMRPRRGARGEWDETAPACRLCGGEGEVPDIVYVAWERRAYLGR